MNGPRSATPPAAFAAALASLVGIGPRRLGALLGRWSPEEVWSILGEGRLDIPADEGRVSTSRPATVQLARRWQRQVRSTDVAAAWDTLQAAGMRVEVLGHPGYPRLLADDHEAPAVLFWRGDLGPLERRRVAIVGTRRCSSYGREMARELGRDLASEGVTVVSGLALGVDAAAHAGALEVSKGPPVAVVGSGLDVVYPRENAELWDRVAAGGLLCGEAPPGAAPEAWRFPVRNRIIAALSEVMVVVESHSRGGSRHSVEAAESRCRTVMAVPGSVRSSASDYPNQLLADGCPPARDATDVLVALGLSSATRSPGPDPRPPPREEDAAVLAGLGWEPATFEEVVLRSGRSPAEVSLALTRLERDRWVTSRSAWWERCAR